MELPLFERSDECLIRELTERGYCVSTHNEIETAEQQLIETLRVAFLTRRKAVVLEAAHELLYKHTGAYYGLPTRDD